MRVTRRRLFFEGLEDRQLLAGEVIAFPDAQIVDGGRNDDGAIVFAINEQPAGVPNGIAKVVTVTPDGEITTEPIGTADTGPIHVNAVAHDGSGLAVRRVVASAPTFELF